MFSLIWTHSAMIGCEMREDWLRIRIYRGQKSKELLCKDCPRQGWGHRKTLKESDFIIFFFPNAFLTVGIIV